MTNPILAADDCGQIHTESFRMDFGDTMACVVGEFHWKDGLTFQRLPDGCVFIRQWWRLPNGQWIAEPVMLMARATWTSIQEAVREIAS